MFCLHKEKPAQGGSVWGCWLSGRYPVNIEGIAVSHCFRIAALFTPSGDIGLALNCVTQSAGNGDHVGVSITIDINLQRIVICIWPLV
jgi:hypothetical protein